VPDVAELQVVISADTRGFDTGVKHVETAAKGLGDSVSKGVGLGLGFAALEKGMSAVAAGFGAAKGAVIDLNSSLEQSKIAFTTMLGSAEKADAFLDSLAKFAAETPFEFPDLVNASKRMFAFGFQAKEVVPLLTAVGDAVAAVGGGAEVIDGVTTALGQMQAKGKVSAEEMNQLAERGIPAWDMLAKKMGVSVAEAMEASAKGQVKAETMLAAFQEGAAARFGGMMAKQAKTWQGALSTISDSLNMAMARAFRPFFDLLSSGAVAVAQFLSDQAFADWASTVADGMAQMLKDGMELGRWLMTELRPAWDWVLAHGDDIKAVFVGAAGAIGALVAAGAVVPIITAVGGALTALLSPIALVAAAGAALALAWQYNWLGIRDRTTEAVTYLTTTVWPMLQTAMNTVATWIATTLVPTFELVVSWLYDKVGATLTWLTTTAWPMAQAAMTAVATWATDTLVPALTGVWSWLSEKVGAALTWLTTTGWPLLGAAGNAVQNWIKETLIPTLTAWYTWLDQKLSPIYTWFIEKGWPLLGDAANKVQNWIKDTLFPTLSEWWTWLQARLSPIYTWFITYGWPELMSAGAKVWTWLTTTFIPSLEEWWRWLQDRLSPIYTWFITYAFPELVKGLKDQNAEVKTGSGLWKQFTDELAKTDAAEHWVNILDNLGRFGRYLIEHVNLQAWFASIGTGIGEASGMMQYFAEFTNWILKTLDRLTSWLPGDKVPSISNPPTAPGGSGGGGGGGGGTLPEPPGRAVTPPSGGGTPAPSPSPSPSPSPPPPPPPPTPEPEPPPAPTPSPGGGQPTGEALIQAIDTMGQRMHGKDFGHAAAAIAISEGAAGDLTKPGAGGARGPFQFDPGGELPLYAKYLGMSVAAAGTYAGTHPLDAAEYALQGGSGALSGPGYLGSALLQGQAKSLSGQWLANYGSRYGQRPQGSEIDDPNNPGAYWARAGRAHLARYGYASGGWAGLHGPELAWLGERGPEYVVPNAALRGGGGAMQTVRVEVAIGGRLAEEIYVTGRDLAIRRGRVKSGAV
jgi:tape measure domain-containing protein